MLERNKSGTTSNPGWWNGEYDSAWERVKAALARDWEQTKADFTKTSGRELDQDVPDTVRQAAGKQPIPPLSQPNASNWESLEPAVRYGFGASTYYKDDKDWNKTVEAKLQKEWTDLKSGRSWDDVKGAVRHGWTSARGGIRH